MREIKFRAWDKEGKKMIPRIESAYDGTGAVETGNDRNPDFKYEDCFGVYVGSPNHFRDSQAHKYIVMQFTGLHDKNGLKEIYEGDVVLAKNPNKIGIVYLGTYSNSLGNYYGWFIKRILKIGVEREESIVDFNIYEVIGNIYENPELLEKK